MIAKDNKILFQKEIKNTLEAYVFENRRHMEAGGRYYEFTPEADRKKFVDETIALETWIYEDGADAPVEEYQTRLANLKKIADPAAARYTLHDDAPYALKQFITRIEAVKANVSAKIAEAPEHITIEEFQGATKLCKDAIKTAEAAVASLLASPKDVDSQFKLTDFDAKLTEVTFGCNRVCNKPKPKPAPVETPAAPATDDSEPPVVPQQKAEDDLD